MALSLCKEEDFSQGYYLDSDAYVWVNITLSEQKLHGKFRHLRMEEIYEFENLSEFIYKLEQLLEQINIPQAATKCRKNWGKLHLYKGLAPAGNPKLLDKPLLPNADEQGESFLICIKYRFHSSWQGEVRWVNKKRCMSFRSVLELIMLLEDAIRKDRIL